MTAIRLFWAKIDTFPPMKKYFAGILCALGLSLTAHSQNILDNLELSFPLFKVSNSLYNKIGVIDSRAYPAAVGTVEEGVVAGQEEQIVFKTPVAPQLTGLLKALIDNTAHDGELLFQLKRFRFIEKSGVRYCYLSAALYEKKADRYRPLSRLNTVIPLYGHIFKTLQIRANEVLTDFLAKSLVVPAQDSLDYTLQEVEKIDSVEKRRIPLYTTTKFVDGLYRNPRSFLEQKPDWTDFGATVRDDGSLVVMAAGSIGGAQQKVDVERIYAVIYHGTPYVATEFGCWPLKRVGDNYYFTGMLRKDAGQGNVPGLSVSGQPGPSLMSGITGAMLTRYGLKTLYQVMLDHETGGFLFVRVLTATPSASPFDY